MNLSTFKNSLENKDIINAEKMKDLKGGLRYETRSYLFYTNKKMILSLTGQNYKTGYHNGKYCIEW